MIKITRDLTMYGNLIFKKDEKYTEETLTNKFKTCPNLMFAKSLNYIRTCTIFKNYHEIIPDTIEDEKSTTEDIIEDEKFATEPVGTMFLINEDILDKNEVILFTKNEKVSKADLESKGFKKISKLLKAKKIMEIKIT